MTKEQIIQRAIVTSKDLKREAAYQEERFGRRILAENMKAGVRSIEALVGLLQQKETAPGGDAPRAAK